ncbi:MAG: TIGR01777 family oxidoreductase [Elusimicrobia bacterium]|nr:TIGR01777 family oxidoreductase [Elusimicrobiota bacterium]
MNIVAAGGTGFLGGALVAALAARGDETVVLTRDADRAAARLGGRARAVAWDARSSGEWAKSLEGADAVVNLAGTGVADARWTPPRKIALVKSRLDATRALVAAISQAAARPKVLVSASAVGWYGESPEGDAPETAPQGRDFLAALCGQWEREASAAEPLGLRVVLARVGVVLGRGGALARMELPFKLGLGGRLGSGRQPFPWIHVDDAVGAILFALESEKLSGPVNLAAPELPTNAQFTKSLARALRRPAFLPAPAFALRLLLGEMAGMLLGGQRAVPRKLLDAGYAFRFPTADAALAALYPR